MSGVFDSNFRAVSGIFTGFLGRFAYVLRSLSDIGGEVLCKSDRA